MATRWGGTYRAPLALHGTAVGRSREPRLCGERARAHAAQECLRARAGRPHVMARGAASEGGVVQGGTFEPDVRHNDYRQEDRGGVIML